jgi:hypothetical protein
MIRALHVVNLEVIRDEHIIFFEINRRIYHLGESVVDWRVILKRTLNLG